MSTIEDLAERVERLLLRHEELKRTNALLEQQVATIAAERDNLRSRLAAARNRIERADTSACRRTTLMNPRPKGGAA